jgi:hypothetical protein
LPSRNPATPQAEDDASLKVNLRERKTVPTEARQAIAKGKRKGRGEGEGREWITAKNMQVSKIDSVTDVRLRRVPTSSS